ncbi:MAG: hypothetical protein DLM73_01035 [Chthoniobacterales bacterium]|nr:MAG: hypothetical protein DLM73_01035 [Chthoniobacterales bacterium]
MTPPGDDGIVIREGAPNGGMQWVSVIPRGHFQFDSTAEIAAWGRAIYGVMWLQGHFDNDLRFIVMTDIPVGIPRVRQRQLNLSAEAI